MSSRGAAKSFFQTLLGLGLASALLTACGCGTQPPPDTRAADEAALRATDAQWSQQANAKNLDATVAFYTDDAVLLPSNTPLVSGKQGIHDVWAGILTPGLSISWEPTKVEVARSGELGYIIGTYQEVSTTPQTKSLEDHGKFVEVWKKQPDGKWKVTADIFNSDLPAQPPPPAKKKSPAHHSQKKGHAKHRHG